MKRAEPAVLKAADFMILEALNRKPMSIREMANGLQISTSAVRGRIKRFKEMGLVLQQWPDRRWVIKLIIKVEPPRETAKALDLSVPDSTLKAPPLPEPEIVRRRVVGKAKEGPSRPQEETPAPVPRVPPDLTAPSAPEKPYEPGKARVPVSPAAQKLSTRFKMPAHLSQLGGELNMEQPPRKCKKCDRGTPFMYGERNICPSCSRTTGGR